jgi:hypothetical protein
MRFVLLAAALGVAVSPPAVRRLDGEVPAAVPTDSLAIAPPIRQRLGAPITPIPAELLAQFLAACCTARSWIRLKQLSWRIINERPIVPRSARLGLLPALVRSKASGNHGA